MAAIRARLGNGSVAAVIFWAQSCDNGRAGGPVGEHSAGEAGVLVAGALRCDQSSLPSGQRAEQFRVAELPDCRRPSPVARSIVCSSARSALAGVVVRETAATPAACTLTNPPGRKAPLHCRGRQPDGNFADMDELIFVVEEAPEGGYTARALGVSIFAEAASVEQLHAEVRDAVRCHFDEGKTPRIIRLHFVHDQVISA